MADEEYAIPTGTSIIAVNPAVQDSCEQMTYRELQMLAKRIGVNGGGKRNLILNRVRRWNQQIKQDRVTTVNDTLVLHDHEEVCTSLLSPLKSKPRMMDDGTPISILSQKEPGERKPGVGVVGVVGGGSMCHYKQFLKDKTCGSACGVASGTCVSSQQTSSASSSAPSPDGKSGEEGAGAEGAEGPNEANEANEAKLLRTPRTPLEKKKKKRLSFSVFNGVKIIPARAGLPPSPPETYAHLMRHGFIRSDAQEAPEGHTEHELQAITLRNTQIATVAGKFPEQHHAQKHLEAEAEAEAELKQLRELQKEAEIQGTPPLHESAKPNQPNSASGGGGGSGGSGGSGKKMHRRRRNRSGRKSQERESRPPATKGSSTTSASASAVASSSASDLSTCRGSNKELEQDEVHPPEQQQQQEEEDNEQDDKENDPECERRGEKNKNGNEVEKLSSQLAGTVLAARRAEPPQLQRDEADKENCAWQRLAGNTDKTDSAGNGPKKQLTGSWPSTCPDKAKLVEACK